jgi:hypothetical protein
MREYPKETITVPAAAINKILEGAEENIPDAVTPSWGMFTEPGNADALAAVLEKLFTNEGKYRTLCESVAEYYRKARSWSTAVDEFERIIIRNSHYV